MKRVSVISAALCLGGIAQARNDCAPSTWKFGEFADLAKRTVAQESSSTSSMITGTGTGTDTAAVTATSSSSSISTSFVEIVVPSRHGISGGNNDLKAGDINCRYTVFTNQVFPKDEELNDYSCTKLAEAFKMPVETLFKLNPGLHKNCDNLKQNTEYCIRGFIEPLRAYDGKCGPPNGNATCLGTDAQCCNAQTWTCGATPRDCADGICYEGDCLGDSLYTTNGECGYQHGYKLCTGIWGTCCYMDGKCGTGEAFCGVGNCQLDNCEIAPPPPPKIGGKTENGSCGAKNNEWTCWRAYGMCCGQDGKCGNGADACGTGCQPLFGKCSSSSSSTTTSSTKTTTTTFSTKTTTTTSSKTTTTTTSSKTTTKPPATTTAPPSFDSLPLCGKSCFQNMVNKHIDLGCADADSYCLCSNPDFSYGLRDSSNNDCGQSAASTVVDYGKGYCSQATATHKPSATVTNIAGLPSCGQTCFHNMEDQHNQLGCPNGDPNCLCGKSDFANGIRDCANGACGMPVANTVLAYKSVYCSSASATPTPTAFRAKTGYHNDCTGGSHNDNTVMMYEDGPCINTDCQVASLDIQPDGNCPDGEVQISYWEKPNCQGKWFGYGYAKRGTCRSLWTDGWKFKSLHLRCAKKQNDCVSQGTCKEDPEPSNNLC